MVPRGITFLAVACCSMPALLAQPSTSLADWASLSGVSPPADIRVTLVKGENVRGSFQKTSAEGLIVRVSERERSLSRLDVSRVQVKGPGHRARHALIGLAVGIGAGLVGVAALHDTKACNSGFCVGPDVGHTVKIAAVPIGALFGVAIGAALPAGGWKDVYRAR